MIEKKTKRKKYLIEANQLTKVYDGRSVVNEVNLNILSGEIVGLLGPNGAGKTTSFYMIVGLVIPSLGNILYKGNDVTKMPMFQRSRLGIGYLSQEPSVFRKLTVKENVLSILETLPISKKEQNRRLDKLLNELKIDHLANQKAFTLSRDEGRRLEICRSLVT